MIDIDSGKFDTEALRDAHRLKQAPKKMHPAQRLSQEIILLRDAIDAAFEIGAFREMAQLADYLKQTRREYKLEMMKPA